MCVCVFVCVRVRVCVCVCVWEDAELLRPILHSIQNEQLKGLFELFECTFPSAWGLFISLLVWKAFTFSKNITFLYLL